MPEFLPPGAWDEWFHPPRSRQVRWRSSSCRPEASGVTSSSLLPIFTTALDSGSVVVRGDLPKRRAEVVVSCRVSRAWSPKRAVPGLSARSPFANAETAAPFRGPLSLEGWAELWALWGTQARGRTVRDGCMQDGGGTRRAGLCPSRLVLATSPAPCRPTRKHGLG